MVPPRASGKMSILRNGGSGRPRNLVVAPDMGGMYRLATSKSTSTAPPPSVPHPAPTPQPPCALYAKSGYLPIPSPPPSCVRNSTLSVSVPGRACATTAGEDGCWLPPVHATTTARRWCRKDCGMAREAEARGLLELLVSFCSVWMFGEEVLMQPAKGAIGSGHAVLRGAVA
jgi:hypothetical protein